MLFTARQILEWSGGRVTNLAPDALDRLDQERVGRIAPLSGSGKGDLCFFFSRAYEHEVPRAMPGVLVVGEEFVAPLKASGLPLWSRAIVIAVKDPYLVMAKLTKPFAEKLSTVAHVSPPSVTDVHPSAICHPSVKL